MSCPTTLQPNVDFLTNLSWNALLPGEKIAMRREYNHGDIWVFGTVDKLEKLRNCHMLHLNIEQVWDSHNYQWNNRSINRSFSNSIVARHRGVNQPFIATVAWKKPKRVDIYKWNGRTSYVKDTTPPKSDLDKLLEKKAQQRKAYAQHRNLLTDARIHARHVLEALGLSDDSTLADFKRVKRELLSKWHPDLETAFVLDGGDVEEFRQRSREVTNNLSDAYHMLFAPKEMN